MPTGDLSKMKTRYAKPIEYSLLLGEESIDMNKLLGQEISLRYTGTIHCVSCGNVTKKSFGQGFCYKCFMNSPMNAECIVRPELCEAHLGKGRDAAWEEKNHNQPHIVYLAFTDCTKVGVTRVDQIPTRWIDQGAWKAIILAETPYRQIAGQIEVAMKEYYKDKTNWRSMLKNEVDEALDPVAEKEEALEMFPPEFEEFYTDNNTIYEFEYPVLQFPTKVNSINLEKINEVEGRLVGIKGQYLLLSNNRVLNIRNHSGLEVEIMY
ncbi:DUF2797 domain-containing protein [bacterium]|nr:DUF2797 domain-containing protein [bacterium]